MIVLGPIAVTQHRLLVLLVSLVIIGALSAFIKFTRLGKAMRACAQSHGRSRDYPPQLPGSS